MTCRLFQDIKHSCEYNHGGISKIWLLDISDFQKYKFTGDANFDSSFVDFIYKYGDYIELDIVNGSNFTESFNDGIYIQQLTTFINVIDYNKTSSLLLAKNNKYLVVFFSNNNIYTFGSDGGASVSFNQQTGQLGEAQGYSITISKDSILPLLQVNKEAFTKIIVLGTEDNKIIVTEDNQKIFGVYYGI